MWDAFVIQARADRRARSTDYLRGEENFRSWHDGFDLEHRRRARRVSLTMIEKLRVDLSKIAPMAITSATYLESTLTLAGDGWSLSTDSAWRVTKDGVLVFGWNDTAAGQRVSELRGHAIRDVAPQSRFMSGDPAFGLSSGEWLEIFADHATDPWTFRTAELDFVGSPTDYRHT